MKITIDTFKDSPDDIRKVIALLSTMILGNTEDTATPYTATPYTAAPFAPSSGQSAHAEQPTAQQSESLFGIFDTPQQAGEDMADTSEGKDGQAEKRSEEGGEFKVDRLEQY